jgi:hypothetical protein
MQRRGTTIVLALEKIKNKPALSFCLPAIIHTHQLLQEQKDKVLDWTLDTTLSTDLAYSYYL